MSCIPDMTPTSFAAAVVPRTGNIKKRKFATTWYILHFVFKLSQSSEIVFYTD